MAIDFAALNDDWFSAFGDTVTVDPDGAAVAVTGAFREPWSGETVEGVQYERPEPELVVYKTSWDAGGWGNGAIIELADGSRYTVVDQTPEYSGVVTLTLRAY